MYWIFRWGNIVEVVLSYCRRSNFYFIVKITRPCQQSGIFYYKSNMTDATSRAGTTYPSRAHDSSPFVAYICGVRVLDVLIVLVFVLRCTIWFSCKSPVRFVLRPFVLSGVHVLLVSFVFINTYWCVKRFLYHMMLVAFFGNTTDDTSRTGTVSPSGAYVFKPIISGVRVARSLVFCVVFCRSMFVIFLLAIVLSTPLWFARLDYSVRIITISFPGTLFS